MKRFLKKGDLIIISAILVVAAVAALSLAAFSPSGNVAVVEVDSKQTAALSLSNDTRYDIEINGTVTNTVVVEKGCVYVSFADCPDKICKKHKKISKSGESIVCLPNKVVITIKSLSENEIDGVV